MKFSSAAMVVRDLQVTLERLCESASAALGNRRPDLAVVFVTNHFEEESEAVSRELTRRFPEALRVGCSAEGVIGPDCELERTPAIALMLASLPGAVLSAFRLSTAQLTAPANTEAFASQLGVAPGEDPAFLFLGDPFSTPVKALLDRFNEAYPGCPVLGGMASGAEAPEQSVLFLGDQVHRSGGVGVAVTGAVEVQAVVSQGCRPIGKPLVITKSRSNVVLELGGRPALGQLREIVEDLPAQDARLLNQSGAVFLGRAINEYKERFGPGDFLIRNLVGIDPSSGALAIGEEVRVGATVQFHLRDAASADEDMRGLLAPYADAGRLAGAMLFSCNGRGTRMWSEPNHDVTTLTSVCGSVPVAGFFAAGELGPIGGRNFIHGHTASIALFWEKT